MEQLSNSAKTTLNGAINDSTTTLTVNSAILFPTSGNFTIKIDNELLKATSTSGTTFTVVRGSESTTAASHTSGAPVSQVITDNVLVRLFAETNQVGPYASRPTTARQGTIYTANDIDLSWRHDGTNWSLFKPFLIPYANRVDISSWTALNIGSDVWSDVNGVAIVSKVASAGLRGYYHAIPTAPYTVYCTIGPPSYTEAEIHSGIVLYDSGSTKCKNFSRITYSNGLRMALQNWNTPSSFNANLIDTGKNTFSSPMWLKFVDDGVNWIYSISRDGTNWVRIAQEARNSFLTPTHIGLVTYRGVSAFSAYAHSLSFYSYQEV